jgi:hypothetical protein
MCSLGHHDHTEDVRAPNAKPPRVRRRHLDGTASAILASMPRKMRKANEARVHADLIASVKAERDGPFVGQFEEQLELVPPHEQHLPDRDSKGAEPPWYIKAYG